MQSKLYMLKASIERTLYWRRIHQFNAHARLQSKRLKNRASIQVQIIIPAASDQNQRQNAFHSIADLRLPKIY
jgi:hypothetical protein